MSRPRLLKPGAMVGDYQVVSLLGVGGMGAVYRARHEALDRQVALKVIHADAARSPDDRERLLRECRIHMSLVHENLVRFLDSGEAGERIYLALELIEGPSLLHVIRDGEPLPTLRFRSIATDLLEALTFLHEQEILHRDIKPANILLDDRDVARLTDFGIAKAPDSQTLTQDDVLVGTVFYIAPESVSDEPVGAPADVYALGVSLYQALARDLPYAGTTAAEYLTQVVAGRPRPLSGRATHAPLPVVRLIESMMARRPEDRPSAAEARDRLAASTPSPRARHPTTSTRDHTLARDAETPDRELRFREDEDRTPRQERRPRRGPAFSRAAAFGVIGVLVGVGLIGGLSTGDPVRTEPPSTLATPEPSPTDPGPDLDHLASTLVQIDRALDRVELGTGRSGGATEAELFRLLVRLNDVRQALPETNPLWLDLVNTTDRLLDFVGRENGFREGGPLALPLRRLETGGSTTATAPYPRAHRRLTRALMVWHRHRTPAAKRALAQAYATAAGILESATALRPATDEELLERVRYLHRAASLTRSGEAAAFLTGLEASAAFSARIQQNMEDLTRDVLDRETAGFRTGRAVALWLILIELVERLHVGRQGDRMRQDTLQVMGRVVPALRVSPSFQKGPDDVARVRRQLNGLETGTTDPAERRLFQKARALLPGPPGREGLETGDQRPAPPRPTVRARRHSSTK